jgi:hypothetical protein
VPGANAAPGTAGSAAVPQTSPASSWTITPPTATAIKHVVVLYDEIENNWLGGKRIGGGSFDAIAGNLNGLFRFFAPRFRPVILNPATGAVVRR